MYMENEGKLLSQMIISDLKIWTKYPICFLLIVLGMILWSPHLGTTYEYILWLTNVLLVLWLEWGGRFSSPFWFSGLDSLSALEAVHLEGSPSVLTSTALCQQVPAVVDFASYTRRVSLDLCHVWLLVLSRPVGDYLCFKKLSLNLSAVLLYYDVIVVNI